MKLDPRASTWRLGKGRLCDGDVLESLMSEGRAGFQAELPPGHLHSFKDLMMPAPVRVRAVIDRTRALYAETNSPVWDDLRVLESIEDVETGEIVMPD